MRKPVILALLVSVLVLALVMAMCARLTPTPTISTPVCDGVPIGPQDDIQEAVERYGEGTTFCLKSGVHRLASVVAKDRQRFIGEGASTILSGARILAAGDARPNGDGRYYWDGQAQESTPRGELIERGLPEAPHEGDRYNEELFVTASGDPEDSPKRYQRVMSLSQLDRGKWHFDHKTDRIYIAEDPSTLGLIETSVVPTAIVAPARETAQHVVVEHLVVEKYASPAQEGVIGGSNAVDWDVRHVTVRYNHGAGIDLGPGMLIENSKVHHMGQAGLTGRGGSSSRPAVLRSTEVAYNKTLSFNPGWDAGGAKFGRISGRGMLIENSWFHHNFGTGLWFDTESHNVTIRSNRFEANDRWGVFYEVSRQAKIYWNEVFGTTNGPEDSPWRGAGIALMNSDEVEVYENLLYDNHNGIFLRENPTASRPQEATYRDPLAHIVTVSVRGNDITMSRGATGMRVDSRNASSYWDSSNVQFSGNTYRLDNETSARFLGRGNGMYTFDEWTDLGNDRDGELLPASTGGSLPEKATPFRTSEYGARSD